MAVDKSQISDLHFWWSSSALIRAESLFAQANLRLNSARMALSAENRTDFTTWVASDAARSLSNLHRIIHGSEEFRGATFTIHADGPGFVLEQIFSQSALNVKTLKLCISALSDCETGIPPSCEDQGDKTKAACELGANIDIDMNGIVDWVLTHEGISQTTIPTLTRAGLAYLWWVCKSQFGQARHTMAYVFAEYILAAGASDRRIGGLATTFLKDQRTYQKLSSVANSGLDVTDWLLTFATKVLEAQRRQVVQFEFRQTSRSLFDQSYKRLNARQLQTLDALIDGGAEGYPGGLCAADHMELTGTSIATATRDLANLVTLGVLNAKGANKWRRYQLAVPRDPVRCLTQNDIT